MRRAPKPTTVILALILLGAAGLYIFALTPNNFGFYHDDAIYLTAAKALATDQGYRIISLPGDPVETKSPPLYPSLLSLIWRINSRFPENLPSMMILSVFAGLGSLLIGWFYLTKFSYASEWQALLIVGLAAINWRTVVLATGLYSELFYTFLSIGALCLAERYEKPEQKWPTGVALGMMMGLAFLTRTAGIVLLIAVAMYYIVRRQFWRSILPFAIAGLFVFGWVAWGYLHKATGGGANAAYHESYLQTLRIVVGDLKAQTNSSGLVVFLSIVGNNLHMLVRVAIPAVVLALPYYWAQNLGENLRAVALGIILVPTILICFGFVRQVRARLRLVHLYVILYFALHLVWPYSGQDRFLMPLLLFLLLFLSSEIGALFSLSRKEISAGGASRVLVVSAILFVPLLIASLSAYYYGAGVHAVLTSAKQKAANRAAEDEEAVEWIRENTDPSDVLICYRDPSYYLYTGRKAVRCSPLREGGLVGGAPVTPEERAKTIFRIIEENDPQFLVLTTTDLELEYQADAYQKAYKVVLEENPGIFVPVFRSSDSRCVIYRISDHTK